MDAPAKQPAVEVEVEVETTNTLCWSCGAPVPDDAADCEWCAANLPDPRTEE